MTEEKPRRSGWCPPWKHDTDHARCQERLDDGRLTRCECPDGHTEKGSACPT